MTDGPPKPRPRSLAATLAATLTAALMTGLYMLASAATGGGVMLIYLTNLPRTVQSPYLLAALIILGFFIAAAINGARPCRRNAPPRNTPNPRLLVIPAPRRASHPDHLARQNYRCILPFHQNQERDCRTTPSS
jgi:hypothetical protein